MSSVRPELKFSDDRDQRSFYYKYLRLPEKSQRTLRVADKGEYYSVFDEDAEFVADLIYKTQSVVKNAAVKISGMETKSIQYLTLSPAVFGNLVKIVVIDMGYKLEIYGKDWSSCKMASPGNLSEIDELINTSELSSVSIIAALKLVNSASQGKKIGLSYYDPNSRFIGLSEFMDNELYSNLESILIQLGVKECLIPENSSSKDPDIDKVKQVIDRCGIVISEFKSSEFNVRNIEQDLVTLTGDELVLSTNEMSSLEVSQSCANALLSYLSLLADDSNRGSITIGKYSLEQFMKLDYAAVRALNLFPPPNFSNSMNKTSSLFGLLNNCKTAGGTRLLSQWIKQPLVDFGAINDRHLLVKLLFDDMNLRTNLQNDFLGEVPDIAKLLKRINAKNNRMARLDDVIRLYQMCLKLSEPIALLTEAVGNIINDDEKEVQATESLVRSLWIEPLTEYSKILQTYQAMIEQTIDLSSLEDATSAGAMSNSMLAINPEYDETLMDLSGRLEKVRKGMKSIHEDVADELGMELDRKLKLEDHHLHGWCFRLTRNDASCIRGNHKFRELSTVKAGVYFTTVELGQLSKEFKDLQVEYENCQRDIVNEVVATAATYSPVFTKLGVAISKLDVLVSFSHAAAFAPIEYVRPRKVYRIGAESRVVDLKGARHPCLEQQDNMMFIANDIHLEKGKEEFLIITGPNMGGKSTYIRTVGVIALMNQIGCFIPASEGSEICIVDSILARVGASDSQLKGVSTFMSEMLEMSSILKSATSDSLIIVDELGRGTSTYDGFGLAWSISKYISTKVHAFTLFATHFHELTTLAEKVPTIKNLHVVAHVEDVDDASIRGSNDNITLLYKVEPGVSDQSFGIHVAEIVKFPSKIILMSKRKASELDDSQSQDSAKRPRFSNDDVLKGKDDLKKVLRTWKDNVEKKGGIEKLSSDEIVTELKALVAGDFKEAFEKSEVLRDVLSL
ncbi:DEKNAAC102617 [Brettanomyces naardenensis]|uniref:DEKNAAC102617 n=1 Tax=Brettanomyces naardenensis TaxID=13370 RepID=A0A448YKX0_BRENA|nr:DEKNAAC102617 [Brettanomyces naardenensis]